MALIGVIGNVAMRQFEREFTFGNLEGEARLCQRAAEPCGISSKKCDLRGAAMSKRWVLLGVVIAAACFVLPAFADGVDYYASNVWYNQGQSYSSAYDTCPADRWYIGSEFTKSNQDYGSAAFIDNNGYHWHRTVTGYGAIGTSEPDYTSYNKKLVSENSAGGQNIGYTGSGQGEWVSATCV